MTAGIFNSEGKLLLRRRIEHDSVQPGKDYCGCWELPVVGIQTTDTETIPYDYLCRELIRGVKEETGIDISQHLDLMPTFYPVMFKNTAGEYDLALITYLGVIEERPAEDKETIYVSVEEFNQLAVEFVPFKKDREGKVIQEGKGLLSGEGKRQHCMGLKMFADRLAFAGTDWYWLVVRQLEKIQATW